MPVQANDNFRTCVTYTVRTSVFYEKQNQQFSVYRNGYGLFE